MQSQYQSIKPQLLDKSYAETADRIQQLRKYVDLLGFPKLPIDPWNNLEILRISGGYQPFFRDRGCKYLSRVPLPQIIFMYLSRNNITAYGLAHLSRAPWKTLKRLCLSSIKSYHLEGAAHSIQTLVRANWPSLSYIDFDNQLICIEALLFLLLLQNKDFIILARSSEFKKHQLGSVRDKFKLKGYPVVL